jgi:hypothetical protein
VNGKKLQRQIQGKLVMSLTLQGGEFILTGKITTSILSALTVLARRRPVVVNGVLLTEKDIVALEAEAQRTGKPVQLQRPKTIPPSQ